MLKLNLAAAAAEPVWHDLAPGVCVRVKPIDTFTLTLAASRVPGDIAEDRGTYVSVEAAKLAIVEWEGIGDQDGNPLPVSPDAVVALFRTVPSVYSAWHSQVYLPSYAAGLEREAEKNV